MALTNLLELVTEACEVARDSNLQGAELASYVRALVCEASGDLIAGLADTSDGLPVSATDAVNWLVAGPAPSPQHFLCACNLAWLPPGPGGLPRGIQTDESCPDFPRHTLHNAYDCERV